MKPKPSERIKEIAKELIKEKGSKLDLSKVTNILDLRLESMERYLDEQWEEEHGNQVKT